MGKAPRAPDETARRIVLEGFQPRYGELAETFEARPPWRRMRELGSQLWLDTGDMDAAAALWDRSFSALTTNNTLLNREVQKGTYDGLIRRSAEEIRQASEDVDEATLVRELAFILNAYHGLRLVEQFDAFVSVELHTDLALDVDATVAYARRFHAICPERFIVKAPLTVPGLLAARRLGDEGVPINLTLGFSARQNVLVALLARPVYCNVFLGRLNQVALENQLGNGLWVGEKAIAASQRAIRDLRARGLTHTLQIAASLRTGRQIESLAGVDVMTMPPKVAAEFVDRDRRDLVAGIDSDFEPQWDEHVGVQAYAVDTLWKVPPDLAAAAEDLAALDLSRFDAAALQHYLADRELGDILPAWADEDIQRARANGKIPQLASWRYRLAARQIGLDATMTLSGLMSFATDQAKMDDRIRECLP